MQVRKDRGVCNMQPGREPLEVVDPELANLIEEEKNRQWKSLEMIASEVFILSFHLN